MKGIFLAGGSFVFLLGLTAVFLRLYEGQKYFHVFLAAFLVAAAFYVFLYLVLPADLGFLPMGWLEPHAVVDLLNGLFVLSLLCHSLADAVYTTALTGFSAHLMVILNRERSLSRDELLRIYDADEGLDKLLRWRLPKLLEGGYLEVRGSQFHLRPKGRLVGTAARILKRILTARVGGD